MLKEAEDGAAKEIEAAKKSAVDMMKQHMEKMKADNEAANAAPV